MEDQALLAGDELRKIRFEDLKKGQSNIFGTVTFAVSNMKLRLVAVAFSNGWMRFLRFRISEEDKKVLKPFNQLLCCDKMTDAVWSESTPDQKLIALSGRGTLVVFARQKDDKWKNVSELCWNLDSISPSVVENRIAMLDNENCLMFGDPMGDRMGRVHTGGGAQITCFEWGPNGELIYGHENGVIKVVNTGETIDDPIRHRRVLSKTIPYKVVSIQYWKSLDGSEDRSRPRLAIAYRNGRIQIRKDVSRKPIHDDRYEFEPKFMRWSPDGHSLAIVAVERNIKRPFNTSVYFLSPRGELLARLNFVKIQNVRGISWCPSGRMLHVAGDQYVKLLFVEPFFRNETSPTESSTDSESNLGTVERIGNMFKRILNL